MRQILAVLACVTVLGACSTTTPAERLAQHQASCAGYGFKPNTDAYSTCMMQMDLAAKENDARRRAAMADALQDLGNSMQTRRPMSCNTFGSAQNTGFGTVYGNSTTTCY